MSDVKKQLLDKMANKTAVVGIVGLGYVGLPLATEFAKSGYKTIGFDVQSINVRSSDFLFCILAYNAFVDRRN